MVKEETHGSLGQVQLVKGVRREWGILGRVIRHCEGRRQRMNNEAEAEERIMSAKIPR